MNLTSWKSNSLRAWMAARGGCVRRKARFKEQSNLRNFVIKLNWGMDGCARWRRRVQGQRQREKECKELESKIELVNKFQKNVKNC